MKYSLRFCASIAFTSCLAAVVGTAGCASDGPREFGSNGGKSAMSSAGSPNVSPMGGTGGTADFTVANVTLTPP